MIVSLAVGADAELVRAELARLGLWGAMERSRDGASSHFLIAQCSSNCDVRDIEKIRGVVSDPGAALSDGPQALELGALLPLARSLESMWNVTRGAD